MSPALDELARSAERGAKFSRVDGCILAARLEKPDVFVDPLFLSGKSDVAAVFASPRDAGSAISIAKQFVGEQAR